MGSDEAAKSQGESKAEKPDDEKESDQTTVRREGSPAFKVSDPRPRSRYQTAKRFRPGDYVYVRVAGSATLQGPFLIASSTKTGGYTLCLPSGEAAMNGGEIAEDQLAEAP